MSWNELVDKRGRGSKVFRDSVNPAKHSLDSQVGTAWHYPSVLDSGIYDTEVDLTPERVLALGHDGWRVTNNGWHYFLGQPNGLADGFVGFGGRQGDKWLLFRLARVGYIHWPTRAWQDIGGAPTYDRANLSQQTNNVTINTTGQTIPVETVATWSDLWNTPGGGALDASWRIDGNRLKEEITINQAARTWIAANRPPTTAPADTYFSFVFRLGSAPDVNNIVMDLSYLPRWLKQGILQDPQGDFDDDDGTEGITVQNALQEFLFFLPISEAYVYTTDAEGNPVKNAIKLRKRIYKDGADYYLLVGAKVTDLVGLPAGDLVFDPSINEQVGASADDCYQDWWQADPDLTDAGGNYAPISNGIRTCGHRFTTVGVGQGDTIDNGTYVSLSKNGTSTQAQYGTFYGIDLDDVATFGDTDSLRDTGIYPETTATVPINQASQEYVHETFYILPIAGEYKAVVQEIVDRGSWASGNDMGFIWKGTGTDYAGGAFYHYDGNASLAPKLHIEYTAAAAGAPTGTLYGSLYGPLGGPI